MVLGKKSLLLSAGLSAGLFLFASAAPLMAQEEDPPARVARLNYLNGNVSMEPAGVNDWVPAELNRPFTVGDYLYTDEGGQAELHVDVAAIRMGSQTSFGFLNLDDRTVQLKLTEGDLSIRVHNFGSDQVFEVDTPNAAVNLVRDGLYRFRVDGNGNMSFVVVREGQAEITGGGQSFAVNPDNSVTLNGTDQLAYDVELAPQPDDFDRWCEGREAREERAASTRYLPPTVIGAEDLGAYGNWQDSSDYGPVWYPNSVSPGWAPYHDGHWAWIDPWGWTWVDSMPWGFAPFHYGRWVYARDRWGWCPGPIAVGYRGPAIRPYYAPALVAWFGGEHFGVGISAGGGPSLGWVPLGWGEVYTPSYRCSPRYFNNVNVYNTRIVNNVNITNVYNTVYVNKQVYNQQFVNVRAPNAVMAMPHTAFVSGRPVQQAAAPVRAAQLAQVRQAAVVVPPVTPTRQSFVASASNRPAVRPAAQVVQRPVVARATPPPAAAPFAATQASVQRQAGQPFNAAAIRGAAPQTQMTRPALASIRQAPPAKPVTVRPGKRVGTAAAPVGGHAPVASAPGRPGQIGTPSNRGEIPGQPAVATPRGGVSGPVERQPQPTGPASQGQPAPAAHGLPPNMRPQPTSQNQAQQPATGGRYSAPPAANGRYPQPASPQNSGRPAEVTPAPNGRYTQPAAPAANRPATQEQQPEYNTRPQQPAPQRTQPAPERGVPPNMQGQRAPVQPAPAERNVRPAQPEAVQPRYGQPVAPSRSEPQAQQPQPRYQPQSQAPERAQPPSTQRETPERTSSPSPNAQQQRAQPAPQERRPSPQTAAPPPPRQERSQPSPAPQQQQRESKPAGHEDHAKPDHEKK